MLILPMQFFFNAFEMQPFSVYLATNFIYWRFCSRVPTIYYTPQLCFSDQNNTNTDNFRL